MRGSLSEKKLEEIGRKIPSIDEKLLSETGMNIDVAIHDLSEKKKLNVALVCLIDACNRFTYSQMALNEMFACLSWYREESPKAPSEMGAIYTAKFYAAYATLLLYSTGEDIAAFIINFLDIDKKIKLFLKEPSIEKKLKRNKIFSNAAKVGFYMGSKLPENEITKIIISLDNNPKWKKALKYRNEWVHNKPPIIDGLGVEYSRDNQLIENEKGELSFGFGGGSVSKYNIDELSDIILSAVKAVSITLSSLLEIINKLRDENCKKYNIKLIEK